MRHYTVSEFFTPKQLAAMDSRDVVSLIRRNSGDCDHHWYVREAVLNRAAGEIEKLEARLAECSIGCDLKLPDQARWKPMNEEQQIEAWWNSVKDSDVWSGALISISWNDLWEGARVDIRDIYRGLLSQAGKSHE